MKITTSNCIKPTSIFHFLLISVTAQLEAQSARELKNKKQKTNFFFSSFFLRGGGGWAGTFKHTLRKRSPAVAEPPIHPRPTPAPVPPAPPSLQRPQAAALHYQRERGLRRGPEGTRLPLPAVVRPCRVSREHKGQPREGGVHVPAACRPRKVNSFLTAPCTEPASTSRRGR